MSPEALLRLFEAACEISLLLFMLKRKPFQEGDT